MTKARDAYNIFQVLVAEVTLEPMVCIFCQSNEIEYNQQLQDAYCGNCGKWQIEELERQSALEKLVG